MLKKTKAQSIGEYVILIGIVVAFAATMFPMVKRGTQSLIKAGADQLGSQKNSDQDFSGMSEYSASAKELINKASSKGYLDSYNTVSRSVSETEKREWPGVMQKTTYDRSDIQFNSLSPMGFMPDAD